MLRVVYDDRFLEHRTGFSHPERPARLRVFVEGLEAGGNARSSWITPSAIDRARLAAVHDPRYTKLIEDYCLSLREDEIGELPTGDTTVGHDSFEIALLAAGAAVACVDRAEPDAPMLAAVRPPGHHAEPARGMGFCLLNNAALAAAHARSARGPVLIVDFDYHHGNGTQAWVERALESKGAPLGLVSTQAYPAYPGSGAFEESQVRDRGFIIDIPLSHETNTEDFVAAWSSLLPAALRRVEPATIVVSAGFDFLEDDPIAGLPIKLSAVDALCGLLGDAAARSGASLVFVLEGGYSLDNLKGSGESLARSFGADSINTRVPPSSLPRDERLLAMTREAISWLS